MSRFLSAGINVASTSMVWLVAPHHADDWLRVPLEAACKAGTSSLYVNGMDPGYSGDTEVIAALSLVTRARSVTVQEIFDYGNYDDYEFTGRSMGFGMSPEEGEPMLFLPGGVITSMWSGPVRNLAAQLGGRTRRDPPTRRTVVRRLADRVHDVHRRAGADGRGPVRGGGTARR